MAELKPCVLLSIQPKWCELIASGEKTVEIRKTKPKIETPFKCYIYYTKEYYRKGDGYFQGKYCGKVIGEFICDEIKWHGESAYIVKEDCIKALEGSCLTEKEFHNYMGYPPVNPYQDLKEALKKYQFYGWHISDIVIYDTPKELNEFKKPSEYRVMSYQKRKSYLNGFTRPPQSWCYIEEG